MTQTNNKKYFKKYIDNKRIDLLNGPVNYFFMMKRIYICRSCFHHRFFRPAIAYEEFAFGQKLSVIFLILVCVIFFWQIIPLH
jgi:hypothetical protein